MKLTEQQADALVCLLYDIAKLAIHEEHSQDMAYTDRQLDKLAEELKTLLESL